MADLTIDSLLQKYFDLDGRIDEMSKRHAEEMKPLSEAQATIKNYLQHLMNQLGTDQVKAKGVGIAFTKMSRTCQMADAEAFKQFVFEPVIQGIQNYLTGSGIELNDTDRAVLQNVVLAMPMWDMIDFRAGQKGIKEYVENGGQVPGVNINSFATVSIRRA